MSKLCWLLCAVLLLSIAACSGSKSTTSTSPTSPTTTTTSTTSATASSAKTLVGTWSTLVTGTPAGDVPAELAITKTGDVYVGTFTAPGGSPVKLNDVKVVDNKFSGSFYASEYGMDIYFTVELKPDTDTLEGWVLDSYKMTGKRKM